MNSYRVVDKMRRPIMIKWGGRTRNYTRALERFKGSINCFYMQGLPINLKSEAKPNYQRKIWTIRTKCTLRQFVKPHYKLGQIFSKK